MPRAVGFRLTKYYLDCVTRRGAAYVAYCARLRWRHLGVSYAALLGVDEAGSVRERHIFGSVAGPAVAVDAITWSCPRLGVIGRWVPSAPAERAKLLEERGRGILWEGLAPRAACELRLEDGSQASGTGYVERLELTIPPWRLPFDTLHWGRFLADDTVLYWIAWDGETRLRHIRLNGRPLPDAHFDDQSVRFPRGETGGDDVVLRFLATRTLRRGPIVSALEPLPALLRRVPGRFHVAEEEKWVSQACSNVSGRITGGWAVHERVRLR